MQTLKNFGGICKIYIAFCPKLPAVPFKSTVFTEDLTRGFSTKYTDISDAILLNSAAWTAQQKKTPNGILYAQKINFSVPVLSDDRLAFFQKNDGRKCAVILELQGQFGRVLIGTKTEPLTILADFLSGKTAKDNQEFNVKIEGQTFVYAIKYNSEQSLGDYDIINDFDGNDFL